MHSLFYTAYQTHPALAVIAEATLPALCVLTVACMVIEQRAGRLKQPALLWICAFVSIALVYILRRASHADGHWLWGQNYSTHTAFAISILVTLAACRRFVLLPFATAVTAAYLWLVTYLHYHAVGDVFSTAAVILPLSILCHGLFWQKTIFAKSAS